MHIILWVKPKYLPTLNTIILSNTVDENDLNLKYLRDYCAIKTLNDPFVNLIQISITYNIYVKLLDLDLI
jgi:hypothetical protein